MAGQAKRPSQPNIYVNRTDCAKVLGISPRYLDELVKEKKLFSPNEFGVYDLKIVVPIYVKHLKEGTDKAGLTDARRKLTEMQLEKTKMAIELAKGNLHRAEDVKAVTAHMIAVTRSRLLEVPHKLAYRVMAVRDIEAVKSVIQAEIHTALSSLAEYNPAAYFNRSKEFVLLGGDEPANTDDTGEDT